MGIFEKLFVLNAWSVGWRKIEAGEGAELPVGQKVIDYAVIPVNDSHYYADPFVVEVHQGTYLFVEAMNRYRGKAEIAVAKMENGQWSRFRMCLKEKFHLSYPNVFSHLGDYYMIPESSEAGQVRLYKAEEFPYKWKLHAVLLDDGKPYVDSSIDGSGGDIVLYTNDGEVTQMYQLNPKSGKVIKINCLRVSNERPAGNVFVHEEKCLRPLQDCGESYGKAVDFIETSREGDGVFVGKMQTENFNISVHRCRKLTGTHTFNRSSHYEVIDFKYNRVCWSKRLIWLGQMLKCLLGIK